MQHLLISRRNKTGSRGVFVAGQDELTGETWYGARVGFEGKKYCGGFFTNLDDAEQAAVALRNKLFTHNHADRWSKDA